MADTKAKAKAKTGKGSAGEAERPAQRVVLHADRVEHVRSARGPAPPRVVPGRERRRRIEAGDGVGLVS